jgi:diaminopimelate decarboxylase
VNFIQKNHFFRFSVADKDGKIKEEESTKTYFYDIHGPLCYKDDFLAKNVQLPFVEKGLTQCFT